MRTKTWCKIWNIFLGVAGTSSPVTSPSWPCNRLTNCRQEKTSSVTQLLELVSQNKAKHLPQYYHAYKAACATIQFMFFDNIVYEYIKKYVSFLFQDTVHYTLRAENTKDGTVKGRRLGPPWSICFWTVHKIWKIDKHFLSAFSKWENDKTSTQIKCCQVTKTQEQVLGLSI